MKKPFYRLTTSQFAKLHEVNKRTLHYYDEIGLFSPREKGENGYRYYDLSQSADFEYIRMLKELHMSIEEIASFRKHPSADAFLAIADEKEAALGAQIERLCRIRRILHTKKEQIQFCKTLTAPDIRIEPKEEELLFYLPYDFADDDISEIFSYAKTVWNVEQIRTGLGSFISLDKVFSHRFSCYDGLYTVADAPLPGVNTLRKPAGNYLCGYQRGSWDMLPALYDKMCAYARQHHLCLTGYAYEMGLNELVIEKPEEYVTQIMIQIKKQTDS